MGAVHAVSCIGIRAVQYVEAACVGAGHIGRVLPVDSLSAVIVVHVAEYAGILISPACSAEWPPELYS